MLVDTHCHIHDLDYPYTPKEVIERAHQADVNQIICIGTDQADSKRVVDFALDHENIFAAVGVHPHEAKHGWGDIETIVKSNKSSIIAIGEIGLDYHYDHSPHNIQIKALESQIETALRYDLPIIFHVREAFDDFWPVFDKYEGIRGVVHSFTDTPENAKECLKRGLYIGVNGYSTFTKDENQKTMFANLPIDKILVETDAPYLTPAPFRGKVNEPAFVKEIAEFHSGVRKISIQDFATATTENAKKLFRI